MLKNLLVRVVILVSCACSVNAQNNFYKLNVATDTYTELTGDIALTQMVFAEGDPYEVKALYGETFNFFNKQWTMDTTTKGILIFPNAFIEVIEDSNFLICDALLRYLDSIDNTSKISYKIDGAGNKKILKVQWKNLKVRSGQPGNYVNLQIWAYQEHGMIEYRYGPSSASNASGYVQATGPSVGISYSPFSFSPMFEKIWIYGTPPNIIIDSAKNMNFPNIWGVPSNGTVYRFVPKTLSVSAINMAEGFSVNPNPADDKIVISSAIVFNEPLTIKLLDMNGRLLNEQIMKAGTGELSVPVSQLTTGMYQIHIKGRTTESFIKVSVAH